MRRRCCAAEPTTRHWHGRGPTGRPRGTAATTTSWPCAGLPIVGAETARLDTTGFDRCCRRPAVSPMARSPWVGHGLLSVAPRQNHNQSRTFEPDTAASGMQGSAEGDRINSGNQRAGASSASVWCYYGLTDSEHQPQRLVVCFCCCSGAQQPDGHAARLSTIPPRSLNIAPDKGAK